MNVAAISVAVKLESGKAVGNSFSKGTFAREWVMSAAKNMPGYLWWDQHGATVGPRGGRSRSRGWRQ